MRVNNPQRADRAVTAEAGAGAAAEAVLAAYAEAGVVAAAGNALAETAVGAGLTVQPAVAAIPARSRAPS